MKLTIDRAALLKTLAHVQSVVERRTTIPILSSILFQTQDEGQVSLTATDMDLDIVDRVTCTIETPGTTTAPAHTLYEIVRKLPDGATVELTATPEKDKMTVRAGRSVFTLPALPANDFPTLASNDLPHNFVLSGEDLKTLIDRTSFAISTEETRYYLNGIFIHAANPPQGSVLRGVATDGHRLARIELPLPRGAEAIPSVILPRKMVLELRKLLEDVVDAPVHVGLSETRICLTFGTIALSSKLIDGTFPDYERVIPTGNDKLLDLNSSRFAEAVDRVATIATEKGRVIKIALETNLLTLTANSPDAGSATEELEVSYVADSFEIGFNSRYLLDILKQIQGDVAQLLMADAASPTVVRDRADNSAIYVLMPMRV